MTQQQVVNNKPQNCDED